MRKHRRSIGRAGGSGWGLAVLAAGLASGASGLHAAPARSPSGSALRPSQRVEQLRCEYLENPTGLDVARPRLSWVLPPGPRGRGQREYRVLVASSPEGLARGVGDLWDSGRVRSEQSTWVPYGGRALRAGDRCFWKVRVRTTDGVETDWSAAASWTLGPLEEADWHARWIGQARPAATAPGVPLPFPWLRKTFALAAMPVRATAWVNPLGYYELYVNGRKVDDHVLSPAVSDYSRRNLFVTHDLTPYLRVGTNCVALWLGRGWYVRGHPGVVHDGPLVRAQFDLDLPDHSRVRVVTDETWKLRVSPLSPLGRGTAFGDYGGERYDAGKELPEWNSATLDDSGWEQAARFDPPAVPTTAQQVEPNRIMETLRPVKVLEPTPGVYVFEMGRNLTGWFSLRLPGDLPAGKTVRLEYSDFPLPAAGGRWPTHNQRDEIITAGRELVFRSRFNYHGFGWVRVTGLERAPSLDDAQGFLIHAAYAPAGEFACSNDLLNRIHRLTTWTYRCLTLGGYVVDCPTRERLGYGGDAGTSLETGMTQFAVGGLYHRWLANWRDAQDPTNGDLPYTAPAYPNQGGGGPMWSGFVVTLPWQLYVQYGDRGALETNYPLIQNWLSFLHSKTAEQILQPYQSYGMRMAVWNNLGDWVAPRAPGQRGGQFGDPENARFINNCHYLYQLQLATRIAGVLGRSADATTYSTRAAALARALHSRFYQPERHAYGTGAQPYLAFPLFLGLTPAAQRPGVSQNLEETIRVKDRGHLNAGMHGLYFLLKHLMEEDRDDLIYQMATQTDYPSWGHMLAQGATTAWEDWNGGGSRIHDTLISIGAWFQQGLAGIRPDPEAPGFRHFFIHPAPVGDLTFARAAYDSPYGRIQSHWRRDGDTLHLTITVPPGSTATVLLPTTDTDSVREGAVPVARAAGVRAEGTQRGRAAYRVVSGSYTFVCGIKARK